MDDKQRLQLQNMIKTNNVEDQTNLIRNLKHSQIFRSEINNMIMIKAKYRNRETEVDDMNLEYVETCKFLFTYYTDIFNKIKKNEIDLSILNSFVDVLKQIEDGEMDQHEGSFKVGTLLKKLYIDSALKKADKLNEKYPQKSIEREVVPISWKQYKYSKKID